MPHTSLPIENPPKSISIELYRKQKAQWPSTGPVILAHYDEDTIVVYVETSKVVAAHAVELQYGFRSGFEPLRVSTSFMRTQAYTEWNTKFDTPEKLHHQQKTLRIRQRITDESARYPFRKTRIGIDNEREPDPVNIEFEYPQQRHTLAVRIRRSTFDKWIETAVRPNQDEFDDGDDHDCTGPFNGWRYGQIYWQPWPRIHYEGAVYRWVNDVYPILPLNGTGSNQRLARKTLELYLYGKAARAFTSSAEVLSIEDITPFVNELRGRLTHNKNSNIKDIWSPSERPYVPSTDRILE